MSSTIGILAIGSLYWDNSIRERWRQSRLSIQDEISVAVPIRYGRRSNGGKRKDTYTMVFSTYLKETEFGRAKILPCLCEVTRPTDLLNEARCLWAAEDANAPPNALESGFGCVVLLRNPNGNADDALINKWAGQNHFRNVAGTIEGGRLISDQGLLQISWPRLDDGEPVSLDLLLATANEPTLKGEPPVYPSAQTIALAWKKALKERPADMPDDYFWNNRKSGITTFQDEEIERVLNDHSGCLSQLRSILAN